MTVASVDARDWVMMNIHALSLREFGFLGPLRDEIELDDIHGRGMPAVRITGARSVSELSRGQ